MKKIYLPKIIIDWIKTHLTPQETIEVEREGEKCLAFNKYFLVQEKLENE